MKEGSTIPLAQTQPNVQPDQILASLDGDTRAYLQLLLQGGGEGLGGNGRQLVVRPAPLRADGPRPREDQRRAREAAQEHPAGDHELRPLSPGARQARHAARRSSCAPPTTCSAPSRDQEASIRATLQELPATLAQTQSALASGDKLALQLGPASKALIPSAQALGPGAAQTAAVLPQDAWARSRTRSARSRAQVQTPLQHLEQASEPLATTTHRAHQSFKNLNLLLQRPRLQPARLGRGGLPVLARLAEPRHQRPLLHPGRRRARCATGS